MTPPILACCCAAEQDLSYLIVDCCVNTLLPSPIFALFDCCVILLPLPIPRVCANPILAFIPTPSSMKYKVQGRPRRLADRRTSPEDWPIVDEDWAQKTMKIGRSRRRLLGQNKASKNKDNDMCYDRRRGVADWQEAGGRHRMWVTISLVRTALLR